MPDSLGDRLRRRFMDSRRRAERVEAEHADRLERGDDSLTRDAYAARLAVADRYLERGYRAEAAEAFGQATKVAFDRMLHFDRATSPLAEDPAGFTAPLRESALAQALRGVASGSTAVGGPLVSRRARARSSTTGVSTGSTNVLVVTRRNDNFLHELLDHLEQSPEFEHRFLKLADGEDPVRGAGKPAKLAQQLLTAEQTPAALRRAERVLRPHLDWADVVWVEWCTAAAALLSRLDLGDTRWVVRLHSYEAFTAWPHLVDFTGVDDLLFVSEHIRDLAAAAIPALSEPGAPSLHVLPLGMRLERFKAPKADDARFNLGLIGWGSGAKDPLWAFAMLRELRRLDDRYGLQLIGSEFDDTTSAASAEYGARLWPELAELEAAGAVRRTGRTDDVPAALRDIGVILSSSVRESFHAGLIEGAASGAVPVVRDWPFFAHLSSGARSLFPDEWVVDSPSQAAERILAATETEETWRAAGAAASEHALETWDWENVKERYDEFLRG